MKTLFARAILLIAALLLLASGALIGHTASSSDLFPSTLLRPLASAAR